MRLRGDMPLFRFLLGRLLVIGLYSADCSGCNRPDIQRPG